MFATRNFGGSVFFITSHRLTHGQPKARAAMLKKIWENPLNCKSQMHLLNETVVDRTTVLVPGCNCLTLTQPVLTE